MAKGFLFLSMKRQCIKHLSPAKEKNIHDFSTSTGWNVEVVDGELIVTLRRNLASEILKTGSLDFNVGFGKYSEKLKAEAEKSTRNL